MSESLSRFEQPVNYVSKLTIIDEGTSNEVEPPNTQGSPVSAEI